MWSYLLQVARSAAVSGVTRTGTGLSPSINYHQSVNLRGGGAEGAYTQQGRAHTRRLRPDWAARPALMRRAAHAVETKAVVRIEVRLTF
jgi:hypothetical protein